MENQTIKIESNLFSILQPTSFDNFTITELRDALSDSIQDLNIETLRANSYRQIQQLVNLGLLSKNGNKYSKNITYKKTSKFYEAKFLLKKIDSLVIGNQILLELPILDRLKQRLEESETALICSMGESEEYQLLSETFPELKAHVQPCYAQSQFQTSRLKGQIKALQSLIKNNDVFSTNSAGLAEFG